MKIDGSDLRCVIPCLHQSVSIKYQPISLCESFFKNEMHFTAHSIFLTSKQRVHSKNMWDFSETSKHATKLVGLMKIHIKASNIM